MTGRDSENIRSLDAISGIAFVVALLAAFALYFVFYAPGITQGVKSSVLPAKDVLWLGIHITAYSAAYLLYFTGLIMAVLYFLKKATTRFPWVEAATGVATVLTLIGFVTGVLFSKPVWNVWWVWDAKHIVALLNMVFLSGVSLFVILTRLYSNQVHRNTILIILLFCAVASCVWSILTGFLPNVHPQWYLSLLLR